MQKTTEEKTREYIDDPRWKRVAKMTKDLDYFYASRLVNEIINSYPVHIRQAAAHI